MKVIDFHTHPYLDGAKRLGSYPNAVPVSPVDMRDQLLKAGITHICGSAVPLERTDDLAQRNDASLELKKILGDFYTPGFQVLPWQVETSISEVRRMGEAGVKLIGEIVPNENTWGSFAEHPYVEEFNAILTEAARYRMVFNFHTNWDWPLDPVIAANPDIAFVAAHPGERPNVDKHIERMKKYDNLYLDLSGTGIFRFGCIRYLVDQVGAERILFATDYPICNPRMYVHAVLGESLGDKVEQLIFHDNAARLLDIKD